MCNNCNLVDVFGHLNPYKFATTWHAPASKDIHTRLNRFYVSDSLISNDISFNFYPVSLSDYDIFSFQFKNFNSPEFGPITGNLTTLFWKIKNLLKHLLIFISIILNTWILT